MAKPQGAVYAFTNWDGLSPSMDFVGLAQFRRLFQDPAGVDAISHTLLIAVATAVL